MYSTNYIGSHFNRDAWHFTFYRSITKLISSLDCITRNTKTHSEFEFHCVSSCYVGKYQYINKS